MKFSIGTKIGLLTSILVLAVAYCLSRWVLSASVMHVIEHEVVDLGDEANLNAEQIRRELVAYRRDVSSLADALNAEEIKLATSGQPVAENAFSRWVQFCQTRLDQREEILQVELWPCSPAAGPRTATPVVRVTRNSVSSLQALSTTDFLSEIAAQPKRILRLSEFALAEVEYRPEQNGSENSSSGANSNGRKLCVQCAVRVQRDQDDELPPDAPLLLVATIHCRRLDNDLSVEGQTASSPRHLQFLANSAGEFLQSPAGLTLTRARSADSGGVEGIPGLFHAFTQELDAAKLEDPLKRKRLTDRGKTFKDEVTIPGLSAWFLYSRKLENRAAALVQFLNPPAEAPDFKTRLEKSRQFRQELNRWLRDHPQFSVSLPTDENQRFRIRSLSSSQDDLDRLKSQIETQLTSAGVSAAIPWGTAVPLRNFAAHLIHWRYEDERDEIQPRGLYIAVLASKEEISADVNGEMSSIHWRALALGLAAGSLSILFSLVITRPLNKIIASTRRFGSGDFDVDLPINDRGEVGTLARSFRNMIDQIRERNEALQNEGETIRTLNDELTQEKNLLEQRVLERTAALRAAAHDLQAARDEAIEANRSKSAFLAQMSHELRTPLNAIIGYGELLVEEFEEDEAASRHIPDLWKIIEAGRHLLALINDVLDISKIEAGRMELSYETFDVRPMIESVVSTVDPLVKKNANTLTWTCDAALKSVLADKTRVRQVLLNLLSNACKFTTQGAISLTAGVEETAGVKVAVFAVRDSGIGMSPDQVEKLFQRFQQADASTTRKYGGTGLGLFITRSFCEMMGGSVSVESELGSGSTFTARIPVLGSEPAAGSGRNSGANSAQAGSEENGSAGTVLIIDDEAASRDLLQRYLSTEGFRVVTAASGAEGIQKARELHPAFITLDVMMPNLDGWEVLGLLKHDSQLCDIPVIMVTIMDERNLGLGLGASDFLTKPIDRERLLALATRFSKSSKATHPALVIEDDEPTRTLIARILRGDGWTVLEAADGRAALDLVPANPPAIIFLDLMMPVMDGFTFLNQLRGMEEFRTTPVVIVTARELTPDERSWLQGMAQQVLTKGSYTLDQLLAEARRLAPQSTGTAGRAAALVPG